MSHINCYDRFGRKLNYLTQWDSNIQLYIYNYEFADITPIFHFSNRSTFSSTSITQRGTLHTDEETNKKYITVSVPNNLLQMCEPIKVFK